MEQAPKNTPIKGFLLYSLQDTDKDLYLDPVMSIGLYKMTASTQMIVYETSTH